MTTQTGPWVSHNSQNNQPLLPLIPEIFNKIHDTPRPISVPLAGPEVT